MKMNLDMSIEEGLKVVHALRECAVQQGWNEDELEESGVLEEYTSAVDAALAAMGISVSIATEPEDDDDEAEDEEEVDEFGVPVDYWSEFDDNDDDEDEDEDEEDTRQYSLTPKGEFVVRALDAGISFEDACELADILFDNEDEGE